MKQKIHVWVKKINPKSPKFIICLLSLLLIFSTLGYLLISRQQEPKNIITKSQPIPTPTPKPIPGKDYVIGQISVKFKNDLTDAKINKYLEKYNAQIESSLPQIGVKIITVPNGEEENIQKQLIKDGLVKYAEYNFKAHVLSDPNDTDFANQWGLKNTGQSIKGQTGVENADIHVEKAWEKTKGGGIKVAVLDTGLDMNHPEFAGKVAARKIFIENSFTNGRHGTHVAGIIAANTNNAEGVAGVCPECQLLIAQVDAENANETEVSDESAALLWAADSGAKVINMSIGDQFKSQTLGDAIAYAWDKGVVIVAAAGNCGDSNYSNNYCSVPNPVFYPAAYPHVVSVAATDNNDKRASFSTHGSWVTIAAPGKDILSTVPGGYDYFSGTSMASPMVAGVAALVWSTPYGTSNQAVVDRLFSTADKIPGTGELWQNGRVNAASAVGGGNRAPQGVVDEFSCSKIRGWAFDSDESGKSIGVHVYVNGAVGTPNAEGIDLGATSVSRPDVNSAHGITGTHGFDWQFPGKYLDGKSHDVFVYAIDSQGGNNPEIGHGNTGVCPQEVSSPTKPPVYPTSAPTRVPIITIVPTNKPHDPVPTFVCAGSRDSICTPTSTVVPQPTHGTYPTIAQGPHLTGAPTIVPTVTPGPDTDCLDPRSTPERINDWIKGFLKKINDYVQSIMGNPQNPQRLDPPRPCVIR